MGYVNRFFTEGTVAEKLGRDLSPDRTVVFLCGNPLMIEGMLGYLGERGFRKHSRKEPGQIFVEEFWKED